MIVNGLVEFFDELGYKFAGEYVGITCVRKGFYDEIFIECDDEYVTIDSFNGRKRIFVVADPDLLPKLANYVSGINGYA